jgi:hypothetical protein
MVKNGPLVKIEGALEAETARLLRQVDGIEVAIGEPRTRRSDATVKFAGVAKPVDIEVKHYVNAATAWQLVRHAEAGKDRYLLVVTAQATAEARDILERHGIGVVDGAGNAHMELPGLLLHIEGLRSPKSQRQPGAIRLSGKAGLVAQALLLSPDRAWQIREVAEAAAVSDALAHRVLARLEAEGPVVSDGAGPARVRRVANPAALLDLWAEENVDRAVERTTAYRLARTPKELVEAVAERLGKTDITYAVTRAAAAMALAPFVSAVPTVDVWIDSAIAPLDAVKALGAERVETGGNLVLSQTAGDGPLAFREERDGTWLVNRMRLYYDLKKDPRRGKEQADRLRHEVIGF